jgi:hypothetical protein
MFSLLQTQGVQTMKVMARSDYFNLLCFSLFTFWTSITIAQPLNDDCMNAIQIELANSESEAALVVGDTRGATASTTPTTICSQSFYTDDVWYKFTTPADLPVDGIVIKAYFNNLETPSDLASVGMAVYKGCGSEEPQVSCYVTDDPLLNATELPGICLETDQEYLIRIWSGGADTSTEGTFRISVFLKTTAEPFLWWETFGGGLEANGWATEGSCAIADSNANAGWKYLPDGLVDKGAYIYKGAGIHSPTLCDGAVGVDSDYNDTGGIESFPPSGLCPTPGHHTLISPVIHSGDWHVAGLSVTWTQAIRQFQSTYFFAFRVRNTDSEWSEWIEREINTEYPINGDFVSNDIQRFQMPGAINYDSIQLRLTYNDNYYVWAIDDVKIIPQECTNSRISDFFAIPPFAQIPSNQTYPFAAMADIFNNGACPITNSLLQCTIKETNTLDTIYHDFIVSGMMEPDSALIHQIFPSMINIPGYPSDYRMTYTLTQDSFDFNPYDNEVSIWFSTGGNTFALEDGPTRSVAPAKGLYLTSAPPSYAYGNYFRPVYTTGVQEIQWGVNNPEEMAGKTVQIYLLQWTDINGNQIAEYDERQFTGIADYTFSGNEGENVILSSSLENFNNPGYPVIMESGKGYFAIIEYQALTAEDPIFFMLASEARNYTPQQIAMDSALIHGLADKAVYFSVLGWSPDGYIGNIAYEVKELDPTDNRIFFGNDIVPVVRIVTFHADTIHTNDPLPSNQIISVFPNPATSNLKVKLEFTNALNDVLIQLINNKGQVVLSRPLSSSVLTQIESFDTSSLAPGTYHLRVQTSEGERSIPVAIIH